MAMDGDTLADEIADAILTACASDPDITFYPTEEALLVWTAVAQAIVNHIQQNAQVDDNGTLLIPSGNWSIQ